MGLKENLSSEPVSALSLREAIRVGPQTPLRDAMRQMQQKRLGCVIVVDAEDRPIGIFTEEVLIRLLVESPERLEDAVEQHLALSWACVRQADPIVKVLRAMQKNNLRFVCVTDETGRAVALTGQKGLMEYIAEHFPRQVMVQRVGVKLSMDQREGA